jgi:cell division protease FtsH
MEEDQRRNVAYHEAGHAIAVNYLMPEQRIVRATIIRRGGALGYVLPTFNFEVYSYPLKMIVRTIMVSLAGDVATKILTGEQWSGAGSDFNKVRRALWGLASQGYFGPPVSDLSKPTDLINVYHKEMKHFWHDCERQTTRLLENHWQEVVAIAEALLEDGDLSGQEVRDLIKEAAAANGHLPEETLEDTGVSEEPVAEVASPNGDEVDDEATEASEPSGTVPESQPASD